MVDFIKIIVIMCIFFSNSEGSLITNEEIRNAILSVVHMIRSTDDKLARHETRERALGETLKKTLSTIEKRQRLMEPVKGAMSRLDDRLAAVETILLQKDERERIQSQRVIERIDLMQNDLFLLVEKNRNELLSEILKLTSFTQNLDKNQQSNCYETQIGVNDKLNSVVTSINYLTENVKKIENESKFLKTKQEEIMENLSNISKKLSQNEENMYRHEEQLAVLNKDFASNSHCSNNNNNDLDKYFSRVFESHKNSTSSILSELQDMKENNPTNDNSNETLKTLKNMMYETVAVGQQITSLINTKFHENDERDKNMQENILHILSQMNELLINENANITNDNKNLRSDIKDLRKIEQVIVQTADNVMDIRRLIEYSVHQILLEIAQVVKDSFQNTSSSVNDRFSNFEKIVLDNKNGALANLTSNIEEGIDEIWRQIGIMYRQLTQNTDTLNKLQVQTDSFVNGSLVAMNSTKAKVGQITEKMAEVEDHLNYLLGRLSLITQEFNRIKTGLGEAFNSIKNNLRTVQENSNNNNNNNTGPGPHKLPDEIENPL